MGLGLFGWPDKAAKKPYQYRQIDWYAVKIFAAILALYLGFVVWAYLDPNADLARGLKAFFHLVGYRNEEQEWAALWREL